MTKKRYVAFAGLVFGFIVGFMSGPNDTPPIHQAIEARQLGPAQAKPVQTALSSTKEDESGRRFDIKGRLRGIIRDVTASELMDTIAYSGVSDYDFLINSAMVYSPDSTIDALNDLYLMNNVSGRNSALFALGEVRGQAAIEWYLLKYPSHDSLSDLQQVFANWAKGNPVINEVLYRIYSPSEGGIRNSEIASIMRGWSNDNMPEFISYYDQNFESYQSLNVERDVVWNIKNNFGIDSFPALSGKIEDQRLARKLDQEAIPLMYYFGEKGLVYNYVEDNIKDDWVLADALRLVEQEVRIGGISAEKLRESFDYIKDRDLKNILIERFDQVEQEQSRLQSPAG